MIATKGTAAHLRGEGIECEDVLKIQEGRPNAADLIKNGDISMMIITSTGRVAPACYNAILYPSLYDDGRAKHNLAQKRRQCWLETQLLCLQTADCLLPASVFPAILQMSCLAGNVHVNASFHTTKYICLHIPAGDETDVRDGKDLRRQALAYKVPIITTLAGARATAQALRGLKTGPLIQTPIQVHCSVPDLPSCEGKLDGKYVRQLCRIPPYGLYVLLSNFGGSPSGGNAIVTVVIVL